MADGLVTSSSMICCQDGLVTSFGGSYTHCKRERVTILPPTIMCSSSSRLQDVMYSMCVSGDVLCMQPFTRLRWVFFRNCPYYLIRIAYLGTAVQTIVYVYQGSRGQIVHYTSGTLCLNSAATRVTVSLYQQVCLTQGHGRFIFQDNSQHNTRCS